MKENVGVFFLNTVCKQASSLAMHLEDQTL